MQAGLSFEQAPPIAVPFRFFVLAPFFLVAAGVFMLVAGPDALASRWAPETLALTHLVTLGFIAQTMIGAVMQVLPVIGGSPIAHPRGVSFTALVGIAAGTVLLAAGFLAQSPRLLEAAALMLALGMGVVTLAGAHAMLRAPGAATPTALGVRIAFIGLAVTVVLGVLMALALANGFALPLAKVVSAHVSWGVFGWVLALVVSVAYQVVPMFQMTPQYPKWLAWFLLPALFVALALRSLGEWSGLPDRWVAAVEIVLALLALAFAFGTLWLQHKRQRRIRDATVMFWQLAMSCLAAAGLLWLVGIFSPSLAAEPRYALLLGVLTLGGFALSVINGMLYKIVPFLVWFHLQAQAPGRSPLRSMKDVVSDDMAKWQFWAHAAAMVLLVPAVLWPGIYFYHAAAVATFSAAWLARNVVLAVGVYRQHALPHANSNF